MSQLVNFVVIITFVYRENSPINDVIGCERLPEYLAEPQLNLQLSTRRKIVVVRTVCTRVFYHQIATITVFSILLQGIRYPLRRYRVILSPPKIQAITLRWKAIWTIHFSVGKKRKRFFAPFPIRLMRVHSNDSAKCDHMCFNSYLCSYRVLN